MRKRKTAKKLKFDIDLERLKGNGFVSELVKLYDKRDNSKDRIERNKLLVKIQAKQKALKGSRYKRNNLIKLLKQREKE